MFKKTHRNRSIPIFIMPTASCLCGSCKITISKILSTGICHCSTCRKMTSSLFSLSAVIPSDALVLLSGSPKECRLPSETGADSKFYFCPDCGSALWTESSEMPGLRVLKGGVLDELQALEDIKPKAEQFVARRPLWLSPVNGASQCESMQEGVREALMKKLHRSKV